MKHYLRFTKAINAWIIKGVLCGIYCVGVGIASAMIKIQGRRVSSKTTYWQTEKQQDETKMRSPY